MNANNEQSHQDQFEKIDISCSLTFTDLNSTFQFHYAVQHELEKPLGLLGLLKTLGLLFIYYPNRPSTAHIKISCTTTSITFKHVVEKLEQS